VSRVIEKAGETAAGSGGAVEPDPVRDPRQDPAIRARLRWILGGLALLCLILGAAGYAFVVWMAKLPPGTLKVH
jgi:hypothetical protein